MKFALSIIALILVALVVPFLIPGLAKQEGVNPEADLPWQIQVEGQGGSRVFGLRPDVSTLGQVKQRLGNEVEVAIIAQPNEAVPGGFGYKAEADYANSTVGFGDVVLTYAPARRIFGFTLGNHESLDGMEQITSSRWSSFIERAQANDAFGNTRRLGLSLNVHSKDNLFRLDTGLFAAHSIDASLDNDGWIGAARATYTPFVGNGFAAYRAELPAPRVPVERQRRQLHIRGCAFDEPACTLSRTNVPADDRRALCRYGAVLQPRATISSGPSSMACSSRSISAARPSM